VSHARLIDVFAESGVSGQPSSLSTVGDMESVSTEWDH
jgi:hypothetical protein